MVSFARARTRSWLSRLRPIAAQTKKNELDPSYKSKEIIKNQLEQNKCFLEAIKHGGMWFS